MKLHEITTQIIHAAAKVHSALGPGLLESAYEACLLHELNKRGLKIERNITLPLVYEDLTLDAGLRISLLVEDEVIVELKSVEQVTQVHRSQVLSCLRLSGKRAGLLINFNVVQLMDGVTRMVN